MTRPNVVIPFGATVLPCSIRATLVRRNRRTPDVNRGADVDHSPRLGLLFELPLFSPFVPLNVTFSLETFFFFAQREKTAKQHLLHDLTECEKLAEDERDALQQTLHATRTEKERVRQSTNTTSELTYSSCTQRCTQRTAAAFYVFTILVQLVRGGWCDIR